MQRHSEPKGEESICRNTIKTSFWGFCKNRRIYYTNLLWVNKTKQILRFAQYDARKGFIVFFCHLSKNNSQYCCSRQSENPLNMTNGYTSFWTHKVGEESIDNYRYFASPSWIFGRSIFLTSLSDFVFVVPSKISCLRVPLALLDSTLPKIRSVWR